MALGSNDESMAIEGRRTGVSLESILGQRIVIPRFTPMHRERAKCLIRKDSSPGCYDAVELWCIKVACNVRLVDVQRSIRLGLSELGRSGLEWGLQSWQKPLRVAYCRFRVLLIR
jgi:hypothetical protein